MLNPDIAYLWCMYCKHPGVGAHAPILAGTDGRPERCSGCWRCDKVRDQGVKSARR